MGNRHVLSRLFDRLDVYRRPSGVSPMWESIRGIAAKAQCEILRATRPIHRWSEKVPIDRARVVPQLARGTRLVPQVLRPATAKSGACTESNWRALCLVWSRPTQARRDGPDSWRS